MAETKKSGFDDKFLSKIGKIDSRGIRDYLAKILSRKNFFETIFDHLAEGIIVTDERHRIMYSNRFARLMLDWPPSKRYLGDILQERCPGGELKEMLAAMEGDGRAVEGYECAFGPNGDRRMHLTAFPIRHREGEIVEGDGLEAMWIFILSDVTEQYRRMEEEARSQRLASMALLTSGVAHEIKNPLNSLNLHAQILLREAQEAETEDKPLAHRTVERATRVILEETARLTEVINEFIQAARPQTPVIEPKYINRLIEDLLRLFGAECEQLGIDLKADLEPELPPIHMDAHLIFQALRNLMRNAIDAHLEAREMSRSAGKPEIRRLIALRTSLAGDHINIEVADNGPGIPEESVDKIFEPYYTTKSTGTGLGLMIVYRVVTQHQGSIHVDSRPGIGTRFVIALPLTDRPMRLLDSPVELPTTNPG